MTSAELKGWLEKRGCSFEPAKGGHLKVHHGDRRSVMPMHGSGHDLPKGTVEGIRKKLGLK